MIFGSLPSACHRGAHRRQIHQQRHAGEILQNDARDDERDFLVRRLLRVPVRERLDIFAATFLPSQLRSTDSSTMRMLTGRREIGPMPCFSSAGSEWKNTFAAVSGIEFWRVLNSLFMLFLLNERRRCSCLPCSHFSSASFALILSKFGSIARVLVALEY